ncbi:DUF3325 domain-containing protein [Bradyrhizobium cenepequi]|jgi:hypothetical protein
MSMAGLTIAYAGFAAISLAMARHHRQTFGRPPSRYLAAGLRIIGWSALGLSLIASVVASGWAIGTITWVGVLSAAGLAWIFLHSATPRFALAMVPALILIALAGSACALLRG